MAFRPSLSAKQYADLRELIAETPTVAEMKMAVTAWAAKVKLEVCFDESVAAAWSRDDA